MIRTFNLSVFRLIKISFLFCSSLFYGRSLLSSSNHRSNNSSKISLVIHHSCFCKIYIKIEGIHISIRHTFLHCSPLLSLLFLEISIYLNSSFLANV
ncbi:hypothetical protein CW304_11350 [Bacillus sp. UFRGS-B20]|nr:hypothetical protein CW304_11350 [Bacillus sp. UFRGS-B20]